MAETKLSFMCYVKVRDAMQADPRLKKLLTKPSVWIGKQNQTGEHFSKEVDEVTRAIDAAGKDVRAMNAGQIVHFATEMLVLKIAPPVVAKPTPPPEPEAAPEPPKAAEPAPAKEPPKRRVTPKTKPRTKPPEPKVEAPKAVAKPRTKPAEPQTEEPEDVHAACEEESFQTEEAAPEPPKPRPSNNGKMGSVFKPAIKFIRKNVPWVPGVAMICHAYAIVSLLAPYAEAGDAEAKELMDKFNELIDLLHSKTVLPNCAQEDAKHG